MSVSLETRLEELQSHVTPVLPEDTMSEAARKALLVDCIRMLKHEPGSREGEDIEHVHQMRVATRRMRSIFVLLGAYFKPKSVHPFEAQLQHLGRALGAVRDLDVLMDNIRRFQETLPEADQKALQAAINLLARRRESAQKRLIHTLDKKDYADFVDSYAKFLTEPGNGAKPLHADDTTPVEARHLLPVIVYEHLAAVRAYDRVLAEGDPETLHMLRIEFKRLRYLLSVFETILGKSGRDFITELKTIQDHLGNLNDAVVAQQRLQPLLDKLGESDAAVLQLYIGTLANEEQHLIESFPDVWRRFNTRTVQRLLAHAIAGL